MQACNAVAHGRIGVDPNLPPCVQRREGTLRKTVHRTCLMGVASAEVENKMAEKDTGSTHGRGASSQPGQRPDLQNMDLQDLLKELERPLDQAVVDRGLLRLATFVSGRQ